MRVSGRALSGLLLTLAVAACSSSPAKDEASTTASSSAGSTGSGGGAASSSASAGSTGGGGATMCDQVAPGGPKAASYPFMLGGQSAWSHDDGFAAGYFHTYDALKVAGPDDEPRQVHVFLPRDYSLCGEGFPVVYMNDGNTTFWDGGIGNKTWDVATSLGQLYQDGSIAHVIVVAIVPLDREAEYTHTEWEPGHDCCGVEQYTGYVADYVKGFIDGNYHTKKGPESTAIIGSSHGGLASFYMANRRPDAFGLAGCLSSSFWAGLDGIQGGSYGGGPLSTSLLINDVKSTLSATSHPRLWIDWGLVRTGGFQNDTIEATATTRGKEMVSLLQSTYGYDAGRLASYEDPMGEHDEISWGRRFPMVMKYLFGP